MWCQPNDGGISLGQAAIAAFGRREQHHENVRTMHELSIAMSIVEMAEEEAEQRGGVQVSAVHLKLGALSGVVKEALLSSYEMACEDTPLKGSRLVIEEVPVVVFCPSCQSAARSQFRSIVLLC